MVTRWPLAARFRLRSRSRTSSSPARGPDWPSRGEPLSETSVACCATRAIFMKGLLTAGAITAGRRRPEIKDSGGHASTHAVNGVDRACVVGTTAGDLILAGARINAPGAFFRRRSLRGRLAHAGVDGDELVGGGQPEHLRHRLARSRE